MIWSHKLHDKGFDLWGWYDPAGRNWSQCALKISRRKFCINEINDIFSEVHTDINLKHINKPCKVADGIAGIIWNKPALDRWTLCSYNSSRLTEGVYNLLGMSLDTSQPMKDLD